MRKCEITNKTANFGKTRSHKAGKAGGKKGPWSNKATAKAKRQDVNLKKVKVIDNVGTVSTITISMKSYKKARKNEGRLNAEYVLANFRQELAK